METKKFPEEDSMTPSQNEVMRRGRVKAAGVQPGIDNETRVRNAVRYHRVWGWTKCEAYTIAGIGKDRLNSALNDVDLGGTGIVKPGRKPLVTEEILLDVKAELTRKSMEFRSVRAKEGGEYTLMEMIYKAIQQMQINTIARLRDFDYKTKKGWVDRLGIVVRQGNVKPLSRQGALSIRQPLAYAAGYHYLFAGGLHYECIIHTDDVSVMLFPMDQNKVLVVTTAEAIEWLQSHNLSVSTTNEGKHYKQRLLTIKTSISYAGVVCVVYYIYDRGFEIYKKTPCILPMGNQRYVVLTHPGTDPVQLEAMIQILCIEEEGEKLR